MTTTRCVSCLAVLVLLGATVLPAFAESDLILDLRPGSVLLGNSSDFEVKGPGPEELGITEVEESSALSTFPSAKAGVGWDGGDFYGDVLGSLGVLVNNRFRAVAFGVDGSLQYKYRKNVAAGPHLALAWFTDPEWTGDAQIDFDDTWGTMLGAEIAVGYDVQFTFDVDYLYTDPFKADVHEPWKGSDDSIDFSGLLLQFGIRGKF